MISKINKIALIMIVLSFCVVGTCFAYCDSCDDVVSNLNNIGVPGIFIDHGNDYIHNVPVGTIATVTAVVSDKDRCNYGIYNDEVYIKDYPPGWNASISGGTGYTAYKQFDVPGSYDCDVTFDDRCTGSGNDPEFPMTQNVHVVGPTHIYGPSKWCKNMPQTLCATYDPDGTDDYDRIVHAIMIQWYWKVQGAADSTYTRFNNPGATGDGALVYCTIGLSTPGKYTICVKAQILENNVYVPANWDNIITKNIEIFGPEDVQCDSSGGGGCNTGSCGGGSQQVAPSPNLQVPKVYSQYNPNGPGGSFIKNVEKCPIKPILKMFRYENCNSNDVAYHWHYTSPCGKTFCLNFIQNYNDNNYTATHGGCCSVERFGTSESNWTYVATDGGGTKYKFGVAPTANEENVAKYLGWENADGGSEEGTFAPTEEENNALGMQNTNGKSVFSIMSTTNQTLTVVEKNPDLSVRETWAYDLSEDNEHVIKEYHPDGTKVEISYVDGNPEVVSYSNSPTELNYSITYTYTDGKLTKATKGSKETLYAYDTDKITVSEREVNSSTNITVTEYTYGTDTTTVRRIFDVNNLEEPSEEDQTTVYKFFLNALDDKTYLYSVTDPLGHITKNYTKVPTGTRLIDGTLGLNYEIVDYDSPLKGKVFKTIDAANRETDYNWDATTGLLTNIAYPEVAVYGNPNYQPTASYTYLSGTSLISSATDISGIITSYVRESTAPYRVTSVSVGGTNVKEYEYYGEYYEVNYEQVLDPRKGMLKSETVPLIDGTTDNIKEYDYFYNETTTQGTTQKLSSSPTKTYYQFWNGTTYEMVTGTYSVDIGTNSRTVTTTDADGRHILNVANKDEQTHEKTTSTVYAQGKFTMSVYDCCNLLSTADEDGRETHYAHDPIGRVTKVWTDINGQSETTPLVANTYDSFGNTSVVTTRSDANTTRETSYTFDKLNRVNKIEYPGTLGDEEFGYDVAGNMWYKRDGKGVNTLYEYDNLNRLIKIYYNYTDDLEPEDEPDYTGLMESVEYQYRNGGSQLYRIIDSSGTSGYSYDSMGRLETYTPPNISNKTVSYTYNNLGQKTSITTSITNGDFVVNYEYYANGWLKNVKKENSLIASYIYDNVGNRTKLTYGNESYQEFAYEETDPRYRLENIDYAYKCDINSSVESHGGLKFTRDKSGNPLTWGDNSEIDKYTKSYSYDNNSRLKSANYPGHPTETWAYDWVGNRNNTNSDYEYNDADQLTVSPGKTYGYDYAGNLTSISATGANKEFTYTYNNLVSEIEHNGSSTSSMVWDSSGKRVSFTSSTGGTYNYLYDTTAGIPAVIEEVLPSSDSVYYIREPEGALIARINGSTIQYYHFDELGSTLFMTDSDAVVTDRYTYDAWGNVNSHTGSTNQPYQYVGQLGYYTYYNDINLLYIQTGVRLYNPEVGRYMQVDSTKNSDKSSYAYANDMVIVSVDPSGKTTELRQRMLHQAICINGSCYGFYPADKAAMLLNCCRANKYGRCCSTGKLITQGDGWSGISNVIFTCDTTKQQEDHIMDLIKSFQNNPPVYCLFASDGDSSYNCFTFTEKAMSIGGIDKSKCKMHSITSPGY